MPYSFRSEIVSKNVAVEIDNRKFYIFIYLYTCTYVFAHTQEKYTQI